MTFLKGHPHDDGGIAAAVAGTNGSNVGDATILLYLVVTLTVQRYLLMLRAARQEAAGGLATEDS